MIFVELVKDVEIAADFLGGLIGAVLISVGVEGVHLPLNAKNAVNYVRRIL